MKLTLYRKWLTAETTIGELLVDNAFFCFTLEDKLRAPGVKIKHETAIPAGVYSVALTYSNRFQQIMPLLINVPMFEGIRIHPGNMAADTSGCILVGRQHHENRISESKAAYAQLFNLLREACAKGKVQIEIHNPPGWDAQFASKPPQAAPPVATVTAPRPQPETKQEALKAPQSAPIPTNWSVSAPALAPSLGVSHGQTVTGNAAITPPSPPSPSRWPLFVRLMPRAFPLFSTVLAGAVNFFQLYKWPLLCAAALLLGFWLGWHTKPPERKSL